jgi:hypothetical protein
MPLSDETVIYSIFIFRDLAAPKTVACRLETAAETTTDAETLPTATGGLLTVQPQSTKRTRLFATRSLSASKG